MYLIMLQPTSKHYEIHKPPWNGSMLACRSSLTRIHVSLCAAWSARSFTPGAALARQPAFAQPSYRSSAWRRLFFAPVTTMEGSKVRTALEELGTDGAFKVR